MIEDPRRRNIFLNTANIGSSSLEFFKNF